MGIDHLVVGGAGFLGSHLVDRLLAEGESVEVVDDLSTGSLANLADARAAGGELKIHHLDAGSSEMVSLLAMRRPSVIHVLATVPRRSASVDGHVAALARVLTVLEGARAYGVHKMVVVLPAAAMYGTPASRDLPVKERPLEARGVRGVMARAVVDLLDVYRAQHAVEFTALAVASVYGPRQRPDDGVVAAMLDATSQHVAPTLTGDGRQTRDFVFVDDVVDALVRAGHRGSGLVVNIGTGVQTPLLDLWQAVNGGAGPIPQFAPARPDEVQRFAVSPVRARIHLGWSPWTTLVDGLALSR